MTRRRHRGHDAVSPTRSGHRAADGRHPAMHRATERDAEVLGRPAGGWRRRWYEVIFEADTPAGRAFDLALLAVIAASVAIVMLDSVRDIGGKHRDLFDLMEWGITLFFTLEYAARLACVDRPLRYARSFYGVVDLLSLLPTYLAIFVPELHALIDVRVLRLLRVFRILKLAAYLAEFRFLGGALRASRRKILVFLSAVGMIVVIMGTVMYVVEGEANGFTSIPVSVYWAVTTMTTVGFGDITAKTDLGRLIATAMMLMGWGVLAVPTGIVTAEMTSMRFTADEAARCVGCGHPEHPVGARFCHQCGEAIGADTTVDG
jgi:voltage-gated potassium channel